MFLERHQKVRRPLGIDATLLRADCDLEIASSVKEEGALMKEPRELSKAQLIELVRDVQKALWPLGDADHEWSPGTLDEISSVLVQADLWPGRVGPPTKDTS